jgi:hypothetical protein
MMGRAYAALVCAAEFLKADFRAGKYGTKHYEALEEELARISSDVLHLARTLGWMKGKWGARFVP